MIILVVSLWLTTSPLWGKIVFYSHQDGNYEIYTINSDGTNQTRLTFNDAAEGAQARPLLNLQDRIISNCGITPCFMGMIPLFLRY